MLVSRTARHVEDWHARGLIDAPTARALLDDLGAGSAGRSFASVAIWLGVVCLAFGAMTFVAANWDAMPRLLRMIVLGAGVLAAYVAAGAFHRRGNPGGAEAFVLLGCGVFGAAVMLTGQMYHLPGPPSGGVLLWTLGSFAAALLTGTRGALGLAILLATLWTAMAMTASAAGTPFHLPYLPLWAALAACSWWFRSRGTAHLCALGALAWLGLSVGILVLRDENFAAGYIAVMAGFAGTSLAILGARGPRPLRGFERETVLYAMILVFGMIAFLFALGEAGLPVPLSRAPLLAAPVLAALALWPAAVTAERLDHLLAGAGVVATLVCALAMARGVPYAVETFALAVSIWTIRMGGRQGWRMVTALGYAAFAGTVVILYVAAAHGLLGTSLFYLGAGALLLTGALVVPRLVAVREGRR